MRQEIAEGCAHRARHNIGEPECEDGVHLQPEIAECNNGDDCAVHQPGLQIAQVQAFSGEVSGGRAEGEGQQDSQPVKQFAPGGVDGMNGKRPFDQIPYGEGRREGDGEADAGGLLADAEVIDKVVGEQGADNADQNHDHPVDPGDISLLRKLHHQRGEQEPAHQQGCLREAETQICVEEVCRRLADGHGHEFDQPEVDRYLRYAIVDGACGQLGCMHRIGSYSRIAANCVRLPRV
ncbi:hypothetical protein ES703_68917 [subsurface metagenome]